jgi:DNA-directed RNA polymerase specialized sigma subunit
MKNLTTKPTPPRRRRRRKNSRHYFTQVHEDALVEYSKTADYKTRERLYITYIQPAFDEMVDKIVYTYKFTNLPNIDELKDECKIWLTTIIDKYDQSKGSKAFSYFSVITKNWFIHKVKKNQKQMKREIDINEISTAMEIKYLVTYNDYIDKRSDNEFWKQLWTEIESWDSDSLKDNEKKVYEAIKILLSSPDDIEIFNKKAIYLYIREITGLNTKQIVNNLNKMRKKYRTFKDKWNEGDL